MHKELIWRALVREESSCREDEPGFCGVQGRVALNGALRGSRLGIWNYGRWRGKSMLFLNDRVALLLRKESKEEN